MAAVLAEVLEHWSGRPTYVRSTGFISEHGWAGRIRTVTPLMHAIQAQKPQQQLGGGAPIPWHALGLESSVGATFPTS